MSTIWRSGDNTKKRTQAKSKEKNFPNSFAFSNENQMIIHKAEEASKKKEEQLLKRQNAMKKVIQEERKIEQQKKKKVTCRKDTMKAQKLPVKRLRGGPKL